MANLISLLNTVKYNGGFVDTGAFYQDCPPSMIISVMPTVVDDLQGVPTDVFWIRVVNPQGLTATDIYLKRQFALLTLANFLTGLTTVSATNMFTIYTDLVKSSDLAESLVPSGTDMLLNNIYEKSVSYDPDNDQTIIQMDTKNRLSYTNYYFSGDQSSAGQYFYFGSGGNAAVE